MFLTKEGLVKLGDFGISKVLSATRVEANTVVGTTHYISPEIVSIISNCMGVFAELEVAVGHWPFYNQFSIFGQANLICTRTNF